MHGEVSEWLIELVSKTSVLVRVPRVRIPPSPFVFGNSSKFAFRSVGMRQVSAIVCLL